MAKGNNKSGNREAKKPKKDKTKILATAESLAGKASAIVSGKKTK